MTNNGGSFRYMDMGGLNFPHQPPPESWNGGRIERIDIETGEVDVLYEECDGNPLRGPNDIVFDQHGGFWFTDHGVRLERTSDRTGIYYAQPDGSSIREAIFPMDAPNGIGLSPDGSRLYVAETFANTCWWWKVTGPGEVEEVPGVFPTAARCCTRRAASRASTRSPWTATATYASRRSSTAASASWTGRAGSWRVRPDRRHPHDEHLLRRRRPEDGLPHAVGNGAAGVGRVGRPGLELAHSA